MEHSSPLRLEGLIRTFPYQNISLLGHRDKLIQQWQLTPCSTNSPRHLQCLQCLRGERNTHDGSRQRAGSGQFCKSEYTEFTTSKLEGYVTPITGSFEKFLPLLLIEYYIFANYAETNRECCWNREYRTTISSI